MRSNEFTLTGTNSISFAFFPAFTVKKIAIPAGPGILLVANVDVREGVLGRVHVRIVVMVHVHLVLPRSDNTDKHEAAKGDVLPEIRLCKIRQCCIFLVMVEPSAPP